MLTLCKTTVHTLLGFSDHSTERRNPPYRCRNIPSPDAGGLRLLAGDTPKPPNIVESSAVGPAGKPPQRTDLGARGHQDLDHGNGNLCLCTENLGSESSDDGGMGIEEIGGLTPDEDDRRPEARPWGRRRRPWRWRAEAKFPPPLPWLVGRDGRRSRFMRVVREDGRIVLTEVRIERPEVLRASRRDGRLRLELVGDPNLQAMISNPEEEEQEIEEEEAAVAEENVKEEEVAVAAAPRVKSEGARCVEELSGSGIPPWWSHRFATTA